MSYQPNGSEPNRKYDPAHPDNNALWEAAKDGRLGEVGALLSRGHCLPDWQDTLNGRTALHWAAGYNHPTMCRPLVDAGWTTIIRDNKNKTPLHSLAKYPAHMTLHFQVSAL